jgi:hypothetical protein
MRARIMHRLGWLTAAVVVLALAGAALAQDVDGDGVSDAPDNCAAWPNPSQGDVDGNDIGDACECGDQNGDGTVNVSDVIAINAAIFNPWLQTPLCDTNNDGTCDVGDLLGAVAKIGGGTAHCERYPPARTEFLSADAAPGEDARETAQPGDPRAEFALDTSEADRSVEEGDIYRVLPGSHILNLNAYRGLQVIDFSDVDAPSIVGRLGVSGSPVELYVVGDVAYVLMNGWRGYYGTREDPAVELREGGVVLSVDLSDPSAPVVTDRAHIPGTIQTSRLTRGGGQSALYVAAGGWAQWPGADGSLVWESRTVVRSFDVSAGTLEPRTELDLGGYVADIQATTEALLVARNDYSAGQQRSLVSIIDISDPGGSMVEGDHVIADGYIQSQFNMDLYRGVLRIVSTSWSPRTNTVQTFDASDIHQLRALDSATFADGESLFATLFLGNKAFFVTYLRVDPFHAFEIADDGTITERSEFIVSGWNDFFRPVASDSRLVGIGINDESARTLSVSLYDITDLDNPNPLLARADVDADSSWSEASWDHRAFSVIEDAVAVAAPDGTIETGLVLLPFSGWDADAGTYTSAVQIFSFSQASLTRRGLMPHGSPVRRSFLADHELAANLSESELSLFDTGDPDVPRETGRVELAPNYTDLFLFGAYAARVKDSTVYYARWWGDRSELPPASVEIIARVEHPDSAPALTSFEIPANAALYQTGDLLVTVSSEIIDRSVWPYTYRSHIVIWNLADPTAPVRAADLTTDRLQPSYPIYPLPYFEDSLAVAGRFAPIPFPGAGMSDVRSVPGGLVFLQRTQEQERIGLEEVCYTWPQETGSCWGTDGWVPGCTDYSGSITCRSLDGAESWCSGDILECTISAAGERSCEPIGASGVPTTTSCWEYDRFRYWQSFALDVLDLTDPEAPSLADRIDLGRENEGVRMLTDGSDAWLTIKRPAEVATDSRPYVRYFIVRVGLSQLSDPLVDEPINTPGELLAIEGNVIYTRDLVWGHEIAETAIARSELRDGRAHLQASRIFEDQLVDTVLLDGAGQLLVSHRGTFLSPFGYIDYWSGAQQLTVLASADLAELARVPVDSFAQLRHAEAGRAVFQAPGGVLVFNLDDPTRPRAQAFFPTLGFPQRILVDSPQILIPAGRFGIHAFDLDLFNLLVPVL